MNSNTICITFFFPIGIEPELCLTPFLIHLLKFKKGKHFTINIILEEIIWIGKRLLNTWTSFQPLPLKIWTDGHLFPADWRQSQKFWAQIPWFPRFSCCWASLEENVGTLYLQVPSVSCAFSPSSHGQRCCAASLGRGKGLINHCLYLNNTKLWFMLIATTDLLMLIFTSCGTPLKNQKEQNTCRAVEVQLCYARPGVAAQLFQMFPYNNNWFGWTVFS